MKLAPIAIGLFAIASLASPAFARGTLHLLDPAWNPEHIRGLPAVRRRKKDQSNLLSTTLPPSTGPLKLAKFGKIAFVGYGWIIKRKRTGKEPVACNSVRMCGMNASDHRHHDQQTP